MDKDRFFNEQCRTNFLLGQILEELKKANQRAERKKPEKRKAGELPPLAMLWNDYAEHFKLPVIQYMEPDGLRAKAARARWQAKPDPEWWAGVLTRIGRSRFCRGHNERKWIATFDWLVRTDTAAKVLEGYYDDDRGGAGKDIAVDL